MLAGSDKVLEKRFDSPGKSWTFLSLKVLLPCMLLWLWTHIEMNGKVAAGSEGQIKKKKLTSLLRTLSATAASSSARMTTRSAGDQSLMVETQGGHSELPEDEAELKLNDVNQSRSSSVLRMFNLPRGSPYSSVVSSTSASSRYSPMSED